MATRTDWIQRVCYIALAAGTYVACNRLPELPRNGSGVSSVTQGTSKVGTSSDSVSSSAPLQLEVVGDAITAAAGASFTVLVRLRNVGRTPVELMFTSSCSFGIVIATSDGRELSRPEALCLSVIREPTLASGEVLDGSVEYTLGEPGVVSLARGAYRITPRLLSISDVAVTARSARLDVR